ncbi:MAG TPA: rod shape-determining protein MreC [Bacteroidota bacterium]|nr:rod shape-determining protein MreC [Bacteroidota bacterium]
MNALLERLYGLLLTFKEYVILSFLVVVSLVLLALNDTVQVQRLRSIATVVLGLTQEQLSFIPRYFGLIEENELLRRTNIELADEASRLREAKLENLRLRQLLGLKQQSTYQLVAARIVSKNLTLLRNTITLNVGTNDGIRPSMPVLSDAGLVGVVVAVNQGYSVAHLLLNVDFRASAKVQRSRVDGIVAWDGTSLQLTNIAKTLDVKVGDVIITSEYSSTYPPGMRIGTVKEVKEQPATLFKIVTIEPSVDFVRLEEVFVMTAVPDRDKIELEAQVGQRR